VHWSVHGMPGKYSITEKHETMQSMTKRTVIEQLNHNLVLHSLMLGYKDTPPPIYSAGNWGLEWLCITACYNLLNPSILKSYWDCCVLCYTGLYIIKDIQWLFINLLTIHTWKTLLWNSFLLIDSVLSISYTKGKYILSLLLGHQLIAANITKEK
jgi:hypothetical protein